ncbi:MAG: insulinase family protein [Gemmatimonadaceae bacterium]
MLRRATSASALALVASLAAAAWSGAGLPAQGSTARPAGATPLSGTLPLDPLVTVGTLPNGLRYYIRANPKPEKRAELRLVVKAGSVLEDDDQRGLAHFVEHMAFNGTKNFAKNDLVNYLESIGMRFGADLNAYTSFDETVYMLQVPTDSADALAKGFQILEDWAHGQTLDPGQIDSERGVVVEEWRLGQGADSRMRDKQFPILLKGSRYAERLPIGQKTTLETFKPEALRRFYTDWYRPDLMAVIAVGDFDKAKIQALVTKHFASIPAARTPRPRTAYTIPSNDSTLFAIATDKEADGTSVSVIYKQPLQRDSTVADYREEIVERLYNQMLNQRLYELTQTAEAPYLGAASSQGPFLGPIEAYTLGAGVKDGGVTKGLEALLTEAERVEKFGFTQTELDREKTDLLRGMERAYAERDKSQSAAFAGEYVAAFTEFEPIPGIAYEYELYKQVVPGIQLGEVNRLAREWITDKNRVIIVNAPDKPGVPVPTNAELLAVFDAVRRKEIVAYKDVVSNAALLAATPKAGSVVSTREVKDLGVTTWTLSNGVRVILKPTDFKADQILFRAYSPGGSSLLADKDVLTVQPVVAVTASGIGQLNQVDLGKALTGKAVSVSPSVTGLAEGLSGSGSPKDVETMFQLIHLYITQPRQDTTAFLAFKSRLKALLENRGAQPEQVFGDTLNATLAQYHPRARTLTPARVDSIDLARSVAFYRDRFADASDFTFVFVGNFALDSIRPLIQTYLASLPSSGRKESWRDAGIRPPTGVVKRVVRKGTEPKAQTQIVFTGPFKWDRAERYAFSSMSAVLNIRLRDLLREGLGGVYGVNVGGSPSREPRQEYSFGVSFGSSPERMDELTKAVFAVIDSIKTNGPTPQDIEKVRESQRRREETGQKENGFWLSNLAFADQYGDDVHVLVDASQMRSTLTAELVKQAARKYLNAANYVQVTLLPENYRPAQP